MAFQKVFKKDYIEQLRTSIRLEDYRQEVFPYDENQTQTLRSIRQPEGLNEELIPSAEGDFETAKAIYKAYQNISPLMAQQEELWVYLTHVDLFDYVKKRWPIPDDGDEEKAKNHILNHWFKAEQIRSTFSGLWWSVYLTIDDSREDKFELTKILFSNETFRSRVFGSSLVIRHKEAACGILEYILENREKFDGLEKKGLQIAKHFNMLGSYKVLSTLDKDFFKTEMEKLTTNW